MARGIILIVVALLAAAALVVWMTEPCKPGDRGAYIGGVIRVAGC